jgi:ACS family tartrate transporter-like MFS transporter
VATTNSIAAHSTLEQRTIRKVSRRIIPFLIILYFLSFLNRVNVAFAGLTMNHDLGFTNAVFGTGAGVFFIGTFLFGTPSNIALHRIGARRWIALMMLAWGSLSAANALATNPTSFYLLRFFIGVAEAGFFPGVILYLSFWYPTRHRAFVTAIFMAAAPLSNMIGSPISGALLQYTNGVAHLHGWQWLFIVEALPTVVLGCIALVYLTDKPEDAQWLEQDERRWLTQELEKEHSEKAARSASNVWVAFKDIRVWLLALVYSGTSMGLYAIGFWAPMLLKQFGFSFVELGVINAIPNLVAVVGMVYWGRRSDRQRERRLHVAIACLAGALGMVVAGQAASALVLVIALSVANFGINAAKPPFWSMPTLFLSSSAAAAGIGLINSVGSSIGGTVGQMVIGKLRDLSGNYSSGLYFVSATLVISAVIAVLFGRPAASKVDMRSPSK